MLAQSYRFTALNACGQTVAIGGVVVKGRRWKFDSTGALVYEATEAALLSNSGTIANAAYASSAAIDNSTAIYIGGDFEVTFTAPASAAGDLTIYYEVSTDGGTTFPTNGLGVVACTFSVTASGTYVKAFSL